MLAIGSVLDGRYRILNKIGQGGISVVYKVFDEDTGSIYAAKEVCNDHGPDYEENRKNLAAEARILSKLSNDHIPHIIDVIEDETSLIIVMDYIEGKTLQQVINESGAQPESTVIEWAKQLCNTLNYLHLREKPVIYRDMKPSNIILSPDGNKVTLIDFSAAREFKGTNNLDTVYLGTIGYAAPEQFGNMGETTPRTDIYGLGITMYQLVTARDPQDLPSDTGTFRKLNPHLSADFERILLKCIQKDPDARYQSSVEMLKDLNNYSILERKHQNRQRKTFMLFVVCMIAGILFGLCSLLLHTAADRKTDSTYHNKPATTTVFNVLSEWSYLNMETAKLNFPKYELNSISTG